VFFVLNVVTLPEQKRRRDNDVYHTAGHAFLGALYWWRILLAVVYDIGVFLSESCC
jgi:hypothetical protein